MPPCFLTKDTQCVLRNNSLVLGELWFLPTLLVLKVFSWNSVTWVFHDEECSTAVSLQPCNQSGCDRAPGTQGGSLDSCFSIRQVSTATGINSRGRLAEEKHFIPGLAQKSKQTCSNQEEMQFAEKTSCLIGLTMPWGAIVDIFNMFHYIVYGCYCTKWQASAPHRQGSQMLKLEFSEPVAFWVWPALWLSHPSFQLNWGTSVPSRARENEITSGVLGVPALDSAHFGRPMAWFWVFICGSLLLVCLFWTMLSCWFCGVPTWPGQITCPRIPFQVCERLGWRRHSLLRAGEGGLQDFWSIHTLPPGIWPNMYLVLWRDFEDVIEVFITDFKLEKLP